MGYTKFTAIREKVLVELDPREEQSAGGLYIPETGREVATWGTVLSAGELCERVIEGSRVFVSRTQGTALVIGGREYIILNERQILAKEHVGEHAQKVLNSRRPR